MDAPALSCVALFARVCVCVCIEWVYVVHTPNRVADKSKAFNTFFPDPALRRCYRRRMLNVAISKERGALTTHTQYANMHSHTHTYAAARTTKWRGAFAFHSSTT